MKKIKPIHVTIIVAIIAIAVSVLAILKTSAKDFFTINIYHVLSISITIVFSFILAQVFTDERKQKEIIDSIIIEIKKMLYDEKFYKITEQTDKSCLLANIRLISNNIDYLSKVNSKFLNENDVTYIKAYFEEYSEFIGEHIEDLKYLSDSEKSLHKKISLIDSKLNKMRLELYGIKCNN